MVVFLIVGDWLFSFKCILNLYWNNYFNSGRYFKSGCDVKLSLKFILNHYWNNYFNSGRYFNGGCNKGCFLPNLHSWHWTSGSRDKDFTDRRQAIRKSSHFSFQLSWAKKGEKSTNFYLNLAQCKLMYPHKKESWTSPLPKSELLK